MAICGFGVPVKFKCLFGIDSTVDQHELGPSSVVASKSTEDTTSVHAAGSFAVIHQGFEDGKLPVIGAAIGICGMGATINVLC